MKTQRLQLNVDVETNTPFSKEIENFIEGAVKTKTREWFQQELEAETNRLIQSNLKKWTDPNRYSYEQKFYKVLSDKVDCAITKALDTFTVTPEMITERVEKKLGYIDRTIDRVVTAKVETLQIPEFVSKYVRRRVEEALTQEILNAVVGRLDEAILSGLKKTAKGDNKEDK